MSESEFDIISRYFTGTEWQGELGTELAAPAGPTLTVLGTCGQPGSGVEASQMTPGGNVGFAAAPTAGSLTLPAGSCGLVNTGLNAPIFVVGFAVADGSGVATISPLNGIPAAACGWTMQAADLGSCTLTNTVTL